MQITQNFPGPVFGTFTANHPLMWMHHNFSTNQSHVTKFTPIIHHDGVKSYRIWIVSTFTVKGICTFTDKCKTSCASYPPSNCWMHQSIHFHQIHTKNVSSWEKEPNSWPARSVYFTISTPLQALWDTCPHNNFWMKQCMFQPRGYTVFCISLVMIFRITGLENEVE